MVPKKICFAFCSSFVIVVFSFRAAFSNKRKTKTNTEQVVTVHWQVNANEWLVCGLC